MPAFAALARISWWRLLVAGLLIIAVLHEYHTPITALRTPAEAWMVFFAKPAVLVAACWLGWRSFDRLWKGANVGRDLWWLLVAGACFAKYLGFWLRVAVDPLEEVSGTLALSISYIGTGGRGWEWALPPLPHRIAFYAVWLSVFGLECLIAAKATLWAVRQVVQRGGRH
jgi:hypothetical protein